MDYITEKALIAIGGFIVNLLKGMVIYSPHVLTVVAMALLLIGMTGSERFMKYSGTALLGAMIGGLVGASL